MGNFFFFHSVYKRIVLLTHKNKGLFWKGLIKWTLKNTIGMGENAENHCVFLSPHVSKHGKAEFPPAKSSGKFFKLWQA